MKNIIRVMASLFFVGFLIFLYLSADGGSLEDNSVIRLLFMVPVCAGLFAHAIFDPDVISPLWKPLCFALGVDLILLFLLMGGEGSLSATFIFLYFIPCLPLSLLGVAVARPLLKTLQYS